MRHVVAALIVLVVLGCGSRPMAPVVDDPPAPVSPSTPTEMTDPVWIGDLLAEYGNNQVSTNDRYKGKTILLDAASIKVEDTKGQPVLVVSEHAGIEPPALGFCRIKSREAAKKAESGMRVRLRGNYIGFNPAGQLLMDDCEVVEQKPWVLKLPGD